MGNVKDDFADMMAAGFRKNNGIVIRTINAAFKRGWFKVKDLGQMLTAYSMSLNDIMDAIDYFEDRGYVEARDTDTKKNMRTCDIEEVDDIELRLTADGKLLGYQILADNGIDL